MADDEDKIASMMRLSLSDAATNCVRDNATACLTLRSGVQLIGVLKKSDSAYEKTAHMSVDGGWVTVLIEEIAAVQAIPAKTRF